jgi:hypothetical protein
MKGRVKKISRICDCFRMLYQTAFLAATATFLLIYQTTVTFAASDYMEEKPTKRWAFVLGNDTYLAHGDIPSVRSDVPNIVNKLRQLNFNVIMIHNVRNSAEFYDQYFNKFISQLTENDFALFYYSGHGMSFAGENYLVLTDSPKIIPENEMLDTLIPLSSIRDYFRIRKVGVSFFLLDDCRSISSSIVQNDGHVDSIIKGPADIGSIEENSVIGFSSEFGKASLGSRDPDKMSYFTGALIEYINNQDKDFDYIRRKVRTKVLIDTNNAQAPWVSSSESIEIFFNPSDALQKSERDVWESRLKTGDPKQIRSFVLEFAISRYAAAAKRWLKDNQGKYKVVTKFSPASVDAAWGIAGRKVSAIRLDGPIGFNQISAQMAQVSNVSDKGDAEILHDVVKQLWTSMIVTSPLAARVTPSDDAAIVVVKPPDSLVKVSSFSDDEFPKKVDKDNWIPVSTSSGNGYLPLGRSVPNAVSLGESLAEVFTPGNVEGIRTIVSDVPIKSAVDRLKRDGRWISRVSIAAPPESDPKLIALNAGRIAYAMLILERTGIQRAIMSAVNGSPDVPAEGIRVRFYGR